MKQFMIGAALTALATAAPLGAQGRNGNQGVPPGQMPPAGMCRVWIDGVPPGRQPRATDCATARARVPANGRVIYGSNTNNGRYGTTSNSRYPTTSNSRYPNSQDCTYSRSTNSVGDIIFGRSGNNTNCVDNTNNRVSGGWYQVGADRYGQIYERQTRDRNGNMIVQRARRNSNGTLSIISTRNVGSTGTNNNGRYNDSRYNNDPTYNVARNDNIRTYNSVGDDQGDNGKGKGKNKDHDDKGHGKGHDKN